MDNTPPCLPKSLHWLGDRERADATQHAVDRTGCVMYFETRPDCEAFMSWVTGRNDSVSILESLKKQASDVMYSRAPASDEERKLGNVLACLLEVLIHERQR